MHPSLFAVAGTQYLKLYLLLCKILPDHHYILVNLLIAGESLHIERELFRLVSEGDETAFEELFHLYVPKVEPVIAKMVKSEAVAKDIIQDIFLNIWVNRDKLTAIDVPHNWIFKVMYNRTYSWLEQQSVRDKAKASIQSQDAPFSHLTEENIFFAETARLVKQAIHQLPPQTRKIYLLSREAGLKNQKLLPN